MSRPRQIFSRPLVDVDTSRATRAASALSDFYREEFLKHQECLRFQREAYSECTITEVEAALRQVIARVEELCADGSTDVERVVSGLLRSFDGVTKLSAWSDTSITH